MIPINCIGRDVVETISKTYPKFANEVAFNNIEHITIDVKFKSKADDVFSSAQILVDGNDGSTNMTFVK